MRAGTSGAAHDAPDGAHDSRERAPTATARPVTVADAVGAADIGVASSALLGSVAEADAVARLGEWQRALEAYEAAFRRLGREGTSGHAIELLGRIGTAHRECDEPELAREAYEAAFTIAELTDSADHAAWALSLLAELEGRGGQVSAAETLYGRARQFAQATGNDRVLARVDQNIAALATKRGDHPRALFSYTSALFRYRRVGDLASAVEALNGMGAAHIDLGELDEAATCLDQAYELARDAQDSAMIGQVQTSRAQLFLRKQQYEQARQCCDESFSIFSALDAQRDLAGAYHRYGVLYREIGKPHLAEIHLKMAWKLSSEMADAPLQIDVQHELALVHQEAERHLDAVHCLNRAHGLVRELAAEEPATDVPRLRAGLEQTYLRVLEQWGGRTIESKDPFSIGHSQRVADYTCALAAAAGMDDDILLWLRIGALLHDIGKTIIPGAVLAKPGVLNESEWALIRQHTVAGDEIVGAFELPFDVRPMVRSHHERWDGNGYPDRLAGEDIPLIARILSVADVYDALTSRRSYRNAFTTREARRILRHQAGRALDPVLVDLFDGLLSGE
jgi:putative nucleotidyltransferase with HDIG domain